MIASAIILTLVLLGLISLNFLFVAVEFAYLTVDRPSVQRAAEGGDTRAKRVDRALSRTSTNLSGAQLGITVSSLVAGFLTGPSVGVLLTEGLGLTGVGEAAAAGIGTTAAFIVVTFSQMVFGELVPKNWALADADTVSRRVVVPQNVFMTIFGWLVSILNGSANRVLRLLGFDPKEEVANARTAEELAAVASHSAEEGLLPPTTANLVSRSIDFGEHTARDVMRPRTRVEFVDADETVQAVLDAAVRTGHSRFPIIGETVDDVVGIAHFSAALAVPADARATTSVRAVMRDMAVVPESMTLDPLLAELRDARYECATVVDEFGGTAGLITLEDLIEEIVGDIRDEQDTQDTLWRSRGDGAIEASGLLRPDELGMVLDMELPDGDESDTLGGYVVEQLDRMPEEGDTIEVATRDLGHRDEDGLPTAGKLVMVVRTLDGHRIQWLDITVTHGTPEGDDGEEAAERRDAREGDDR